MQDNGQIIFLVLFVVIGAIKWVLEKIQERRGQDPHDVNETLEDMYEDFREEIKRRQTEVQYPEEAQTPPPLPSQITTPAEPKPTPSFKAPASARPQNFKVQKRRLTREEQAALNNLQDRTKTARKKKHHASMGSVRSMLADPDAAKKAIILKEVLGQPRSMQRV